MEKSKHETGLEVFVVCGYLFDYIRLSFKVQHFPKSTFPQQVWCKLRVLAWHHCVVALDKLLTHACLCYQAV